MPFTPVTDPYFTHQLEVPIQAFGDAVTEIAVREPTSGDLFRVGNPVRYDARDDSIAFDDVKSFAMLSRLTGIPIEGSLDKMTPNDAVTCFWAFARFFIPGLRSKRSEPSPKPDVPPAS